MLDFFKELVFAGQENYQIEMKSNPSKTRWKLIGVGLILCVLPVLGAWSLKWLGPKTEKILPATFSVSVYLRGYPQEANVIKLGSGSLRPFRTFENPAPASQITLVRNMTFSQMPDEMFPHGAGSGYSYKEEPAEEDLFTFYQTSPKNSLLIDIYEKKFRVTLTNVVPRKNASSSDSRLNYEYQFTVSEQ